MQPAAKQSAKMLATLSKAAELYRRQIAQGLDNDARAAGKARALLRKLLGTIRLCPGPDNSLWAEYEMQPAALLKQAGVASAGTGGSGGSQPTLSSAGDSPGYSLDRAVLKYGQSAAVRALTTFGAGCCIACQRS